MSAIEHIQLALAKARGEPTPLLSPLRSRVVARPWVGSAEQSPSPARTWSGTAYRSCGSTLGAEEPPGHHPPQRSGACLLRHPAHPHPPDDAARRLEDGRDHIARPGMRQEFRVSQPGFQPGASERLSRRAGRSRPAPPEHRAQARHAQSPGSERVPVGPCRSGGRLRSLQRQHRNRRAMHGRPIFRQNSCKARRRPVHSLPSNESFSPISSSSTCRHISKPTTCRAFCPTPTARF